MVGANPEEDTIQYNAEKSPITRRDAGIQDITGIVIVAAIVTVNDQGYHLLSLRSENVMREEGDVGNRMMTVAVSSNDHKLDD